jgi:predicted dehydrogenase
MGEPVRLGVIGVGSVAEKYIPMVQRLNLQGLAAEVVVGCDNRASREDDVRHRYRIKDFTTDHREVLKRDDVDAVLILTSMQQHGSLTRDALEAGKHVLVEKPLSMSLAEAGELVKLAGQTGKNLVCAPHVTLSATYQAMWGHVNNGDIGRVLSARGFYGWAGPSWGAWFYEPGGGPMFDLGVYNVTTLTGLIGPAKRVVSFAGTAIKQRIVDNRMINVQTEDNSHLLLDFGNECFATITTGFTIQKYRVPGIELYGSEGTIQMIGEDWAPQGYELWQNSKGCWQVYEDRSRWQWPDGVRDLIESIHQKRKPVNGPDHAYHVLEIMTKSFESAATGQALPIVSTFTPARFDTSGSKTAAHLDHDPET